MFGHYSQFTARSVFTTTDNQICIKADASLHFLLTYKQQTLLEAATRSQAGIAIPLDLIRL